MDLYLLGAGASFGAEPDAGLRPPLGKDLFDALSNAFSSWRDLPEKIRDEFIATGDFEIGMALLDGSSSRVAIPRLMRDMARYFLSLQMSADNAYIEFTKKLLKRRGRYVVATMNYDMLLEGAFYQHGSGFCGRSVSGSFRHPIILKLHGSCAHLPDFGDNQIRFKGGPNVQTYVESQSRLQSPDHIKYRFDLADQDHNDAVGPCMSIYAKGKRVLHCPEIINQVQRDYAGVCAKASKVYIIGARISEDEHIWAPLHRANCPLHFINPDERDAKCFEIWSKSRKGKHFVRLLGFDQFVRWMPTS